MDQAIAFRKRDLFASIIIGLIVAALIMVAVMIGFISKFSLWWSVIVILPIACVAGLYIAFRIGKKIRIVYQFAKFVLVGGLNTLIDFEILNILMWQSGVYKGGLIILFNAVSFVVATTNSYLWNKSWTFKKAEGEKGEGVGKEFAQFLTVSVIGLGLNSGIVYLGTTFITPLFGLSPALWANLAKVGATAVSLIWNFIGYKFIVFDEKKPEASSAVLPPETPIRPTQMM